jgi:hypothetical protein
MWHVWVRRDMRAGCLWGKLKEKAEIHFKTEKVYVLRHLPCDVTVVRSVVIYD